MADLLTQIQQRAIGTKAMADLHPEFNQREHIASLRSDAIYAASGYSYLSALGDHASHVWVRKAVSVIMNAFAPLPLSVMRNEKAVEGGHPALDLLNYVNPEMSPVDLWQQWVVDMLLGGEEGWELVKGAGGGYVEIHPRQPHIITLTPKKGSERYYTVAEYTIDDQSGAKPYHLPPEEFLLYKFYNPRNPWRGLAPISAARMSIVIDTFAQAWSRLFFSKGARPDYAIITPEGTTKTEREDMESKLAAKFGGTDNWFKPVVLEHGVTDIKPLDFKPRDLEWVQQRELARDEIGAIFGVPDEVMGYGRDTYENFETAHWVLWALTILALTGLRDTHLTKFLQRINLLKTNERIVTDTSHVEALKKGLAQKVDVVYKLWTMGTPFNEGSAHVGLGLTIKGGDVGYLPANVIEVGAEPPAPVAPVESPPPPKQITATRNKAIGYDSVEHRHLWETFVKRTDPHEKKLGKAVARLMAKQQNEITERLLRESKDVTKAGGREVAENPFDRAEWEKEFRDMLKPILREIIDDAGSAALTDLGLGISFDLLEPAVLEFLNERNQRFAELVNETTWNDLKKSLLEGLDAGESIPDLAKRVEAVMGDRIRSSGTVIARTEVIGASNGGTMQAWVQSEVVEGKEWLSTLDKRTRETHVDVHGQQRKLTENFKVGRGEGPHPGAIGIASEDIQCRCTMTAILSEKALTRFSANGHRKGATVHAG